MDFGPLPVSARVMHPLHAVLGAGVSRRDANEVLSVSLLFSRVCSERMHVSAGLRLLLFSDCYQSSLMCLDKSN